MFRELLKVLDTAAEANLPGWSIESMKFWKTEAGVEYMEARIAVAEEVLWVRLKGHEGSIRVAGVHLYTKRELSRGKDSDAKESRD